MVASRVNLRFSSVNAADANTGIISQIRFAIRCCQNFGFRLASYQRLQTNITLSVSCFGVKFSTRAKISTGSY